MTKIMILMFHPRLEKSKVHSYIKRVIEVHPDVQHRDMYELYPDFNIDVKKEQQCLSNADIIIIQHPFFWYSAPPLYKQWIDLVLEHGWAYGANGTHLKGKKICHIISSGGGFDTYCHTGKNLYTYHELLRPFELTYRLCHMSSLPHYIIPDTTQLSPADLQNHGHKLYAILTALAENTTDMDTLEKLSYLNNLL